MLRWLCKLIINMDWWTMFAGVTEKLCWFPDSNSSCVCVECPRYSTFYLRWLRWQNTPIGIIPGKNISIYLRVTRVTPFLFDVRACQGIQGKTKDSTLRNGNEMNAWFSKRTTDCRTTRSAHNNLLVFYSALRTNDNDRLANKRQTTNGTSSLMVMTVLGLTKDGALQST